MTVGLLGDLEDTIRSDDGTLLPRTVAPTTGEQALLRALPRLDRDAVATTRSARDWSASSRSVGGLRRLRLRCYPRQRRRR